MPSAEAHEHFWGILSNLIVCILGISKQPLHLLFLFYPVLGYDNPLVRWLPLQSVRPCSFISSAFILHFVKPPSLQTLAALISAVPQGVFKMCLFFSFFLRLVRCWEVIIILACPPCLFRCSFCWIQNEWWAVVGPCSGFQASKGSFFPLSFEVPTNISNSQDSEMAEKVVSFLAFTQYVMTLRCNEPHPLFIELWLVSGTYRWGRGR